MKQIAVIGAGWGDCGKGRTVLYLSEREDAPIVSRFSGGHQAGHNTILLDGTQHVCSNFGSGTLIGVETFWSGKCVVDPVGIYNEAKELLKKGVKNPGKLLYISEDSPVVTPYDKFENTSNAKSYKHGTCGVGYGATHQREEDHFSILFKDLFYPQAHKMKLDVLRMHYYQNGADKGAVDYYLEAVNWVINHCNKTDLNNPINTKKYSTIIFEGSQGLLLDQSIGFFPHVTRGHTDLTNLFQIPDKLYLVTRAYHTRHGNGPMHSRAAGDDFEITIENPYEQNKDTGPQGKFRKQYLDLSLLKYAVERDQIIKNHPNKTIVITCMDLFEGGFRYIEDDMLSPIMGKEQFVEAVMDAAGVDKALLSYDPSGRMEKFTRISK